MLCQYRTSRSTVVSRYACSVPLCIIRDVSTGLRVACAYHDPRAQYHALCQYRTSRSQYRTSRRSAQGHRDTCSVSVGVKRCYQVTAVGPYASSVPDIA
eukprot:3941994-Rhodomonas_salina.4